jgi:hypothetical protein
MNSKWIVYWVIRGYTQLLAVASLVVLLFASISPPNIEAPTPFSAPLSFLPMLLVSVLLLLPYRWSVYGPRYRIRLTLVLVASIWLAYISATRAWTFRAVPADLVGSLLLGLLAITAPVGLVLHNKLHRR